MALLWDILARAAARWAKDETNARAPIELRKGDLIRIEGKLFAYVQDVTSPAELAALLPLSDDLIGQIDAATADSVAIIAIAGPHGELKTGILIRIDAMWCSLDGKPLRISTFDQTIL
jgi:hypothetical protein